jgi:hypothetical protein
MKSGRVKVKSLSKSEMEGKRRENGNYLTEKRAIATDGHGFET